jgi:hypothetical protein
MGIMTTISTYYCSICEAVKSIASSTLYNIWSFGESAGRARAAAELTRMGMHKEARALILGDEK